VPTYEYICTDCGHAWEELQRITDKARKDCPRCGHATAKRLISASSFILKGDGWYETDYGKGKKGK
jgi:putative FmdB family regulatory protein